MFLLDYIINFIGKRPRDLLNLKAVKYMQAVFSIKDAISKKESREISALFGVTVTQVFVTYYFFIFFDILMLTGFRIKDMPLALSLLFYLHDRISIQLDCSK